jgi:hypothetical protein
MIALPRVAIEVGQHSFHISKEKEVTSSKISAIGRMPQPLGPVDFNTFLRQAQIVGTVVVEVDQKSLQGIPTKLVDKRTPHYASYILARQGDCGFHSQTEQPKSQTFRRQIFVWFSREGQIRSLLKPSHTGSKSEEQSRPTCTPQEAASNNKLFHSSSSDSGCAESNENEICSNPSCRQEFVST